MNHTTAGLASASLGSLATYIMLALFTGYGFWAMITMSTLAGSLVAEYVIFERELQAKKRRNKINR